MGKFFLAVVFLVIGLAVGAFGAITIGGGAMAGIGVAVLAQEEIEDSIEFLKKQIEIVDPGLIIVLGRTAYDTLGILGKLPFEILLKYIIPPPLR